MNIVRLSPLLVLLALAAPVRAQDAGPGVMLQELAVLNEAAHAGIPVSPTCHALGEECRCFHWRNGMRNSLRFLAVTMVLSASTGLATANGREGDHDDDHGGH